MELIIEEYGDALAGIMGLIFVFSLIFMCLVKCQVAETMQLEALFFQ